MNRDSAAEAAWRASSTGCRGGSRRALLLCSAAAGVALPGEGKVSRCGHRHQARQQRRRQRPLRPAATARALQRRARLPSAHRGRLAAPARLLPGAARRRRRRAVGRAPGACPVAQAGHDQVGAAILVAQLRHLHSTVRARPMWVRRGCWGRGAAPAAQHAQHAPGVEAVLGSPHCTAQHSTAQHSTAQHSTAQHGNAQRSPDAHATPSPATPRLTCSGRW